MNNIIKDIKSAMVKKDEEKSILRKELLKETTNFFAEKGILIGSVVTVKTPYSRIPETKAILTKLYIEHDRVRAYCSAIKNDGTAHGSKRVYCFDLKDIKELELTK